MATPAAASLPLITLSPATVSMVTVGAVASTLYSRPADALLPFTLVTLTCTLASPSFRPARSEEGTVAVQLPSASTLAVYVLPPKVTVTVWFSSTFEVLPDSTRSAPFSAALITSSVAMASMLIATAARSTVTSWLIETGLPAALWPATVTVTVPAARAPTSAAGIAALQVPSASTEAA